MLTTRCLLVLFLVASCAGDKEAKPVKATSPEAPAELAAPAASEEAAPVAEDKAVDEAKVETYSVSITAVGKDLMTSLRVLREVSGLTVGEVKALMDGVPSEVKSGLTKEEADAMAKKLSDAGSRRRRQSAVRKRPYRATMTNRNTAFF
jgi:large subunit ribosomal protein L7/L12